MKRLAITVLYEAPVGKMEAMRVVSGDWSGVPVEPLDAGLKRILSRG